MLLHSLFVAFTSLVFLVARSRAASAAEAEAAAAAAARHARRRAARRSRVPTPPPCPQPPPPGSDPRLQLVSGAVALLVQVLRLAPPPPHTPGRTSSCALCCPVGCACSPHLLHPARPLGTLSSPCLL